VDDLAFFELQGEEPTADQRAFLGAFRERLVDHLWPSCCELTEHNLLLVLDVDAPEVALLSVVLELRGRTLRGDRIEIHDRAFPREPTSDGFVMEGLRSSLPLAESSCSRGSRTHDYTLACEEPQSISQATNAWL
jgi:hypothetical protein